MIEVADIVRRFGPSYLEVHGASVLPSHRRALFDILACRTDQLGGHLWRCTGCSAEIPSYHGCGNRSCPKCHRDQTADWLAARSAEMLPTGHFHVTVTVPEELRDVLRRHQQIGYGVLMSAAAAALVELARDPRYVGGTVGVLAVLHTWTQQLHYHPHVHCLVTGGGVSADGAYWQPPVRDGFLVPVKALGKLIRGKVRAELARRLPTVSIPGAVWRQPWVVHCTPWAEGERGVLDYLARYVFRTALTNSRLEALDAETVTFRYKNREAGQWRSCSVSGHEFLRRFCQHILPKGFHKVRYYGLWHPSRRDLLSRVRQRLMLDRPLPVQPDPALETADDHTTEEIAMTPPRTCPRCGHAHLVRIARLTPVRRSRSSGNGPPPQTASPMSMT